MAATGVVGLHPVAAVGKKSGPVERHGERRHRAGEAGGPLPALPAFGQVLGKVRVARRDEHGGAALGLQYLADALDMQARR